MVNGIEEIQAIQWRNTPHIKTSIHANLDIVINSFSTRLPDFDGCVTAGKSLSEAKNLAVEALAFHVEGMREDGIDIPTPSSLDDIMEKEDFQDEFGFLVELKERDETVQFNVTSLKSQLAEIDSKAAKLKMKRSTFLVRAGLEYSR